MKRIGITGGIGSGKSAATDYLRGKGYAVIDADEVAREAAVPGEPAMIRLSKEIGGEVFREDGTLDRQELARIIFSNPIALMTVNEILHKDIKGRIEAHANEREKLGDSIVFISAPLLFETGADRMADESWLVTADDEKRLKRVMDRDGLSAEEVRARMDSQMPEDEKRARADAVIENNGTLEELYVAIESYL